MLYTDPSISYNLMNKERKRILKKSHCLFYRDVNAFQIKFLYIVYSFNTEIHWKWGKSYQWLGIMSPVSLLTLTPQPVIFTLLCINIWSFNQIWYVYCFPFLIKTSFYHKPKKPFIIKQIASCWFSLLFSKYKILLLVRHKRCLV